MRPRCLRCINAVISFSGSKTMLDFFLVFSMLYELSLYKKRAQIARTQYKLEIYLLRLITANNQYVLVWCFSSEGEGWNRAAVVFPSSLLKYTDDSLVLCTVWFMVMPWEICTSEKRCCQLVIITFPSVTSWVLGGRSFSLITHLLPPFPRPIVVVWFTRSPRDGDLSLSVCPGVENRPPSKKELQIPGGGGGGHGKVQVQCTSTSKCLSIFLTNQYMSTGKCNFQWKRKDIAVLSQQRIDRCDYLIFKGEPWLSFLTWKMAICYFWVVGAGARADFTPTRSLLRFLLNISFVNPLSVFLKKITYTVFCTKACL